MKREEERLNAAQEQAVKQVDGPMLVVAGAGTGKTKVIVERIKHLLANGVSPESILALTFTEKAAGEMLERVSEVGLSTSMDITIATYNGFGNDLLQMYGNEWGLGIIRLLGETGQLVFLREHLDEFELDYFAPVANPDGQLDRLRDYVSLLKQQLVDPATYLAYANTLPAGDEAEKLEKQKHTELAQFYDAYLRLCRDNQVIDYDDQLYLTIQLLKARPNVLRELQQRYKYVLVDEFQDTNPMQSALIDLVVRSSDSTANSADKQQNIMVVGDDDQSIYGWRGATLANILEFKHRYPTAQEVTLIENYRSTQSILDAAYRLIQHNNPERLEVINKLDKRLRAQTTEGPSPLSRHFAGFDAELHWIAEDIARRLQAGQEPHSIAVLARRRHGVERIHAILGMHGIPHAITGLTNDIYTQPAVKQLIEGLKAVSDPLDDMALFHVLSGPLFALEPRILAELGSAARSEHQSLTSAIQNSGESDFQEALATLEIWRNSSSDLSVGDLAYAIITDSGWKQQLYGQAEHDPEVSLQVQALSKYFQTLKEFERIAGVASAQNYLASLPALQAGGSDFEDASLDISDSLVNVLSVHRAKGLEWDTVYIIDCTEGSFPLQNRGGGLSLPDQLKTAHTAADEHLAEERRLMYVAVTRARRELILTYSDKHGSGALRRPSRFLRELFNALPEESAEATEQASLELFAPKTNASEALPLPPSIQHQDGKLILTVSQVACWLECPQDFYYQYVLNMPLPSDPSRQYGTAIHAAIEHIHQGRREGKVPDLDTIVAEVQAALPTAGYISARSRERAHAQAITSVRLLYKRFMNEPLPLKSELPFGVDIPNLPLKLVGRLDAIYRLEKGIEIRDFKTSTSVTTPEQAKSRATGSAQLTLYALAWQLMHDGEMPALLSLDFVETGQLGSVRKTQRSLDTMIAKLTEMIQHLQAGTYPAGRDHRYCKHPILADTPLPKIL